MKDNIYTKRKARQDNDIFSSWAQYSTKALTVYTEPVAKGRPRVVNGHTYTPQKTADYENLIKQCWIIAHGRNITTNPIELLVDFYVRIPQSMKKADKEMAVACELRPSKKPDIDNLVKAVTDALNELAYWDDAQIVTLKAEKYYATQPRVEIRIRELN